MALAGGLALALSGCDPESWYLLAGGHASGGKSKVQKIKVTTSFSGNQTFLPGATFTPGPGPGERTVTNEVNKGSFSATLPFRINLGKPKASSAAFGVRSVSGNFIVKLGGTYNPSTGTGTFSGVELIRFNQAKLGQACLTFTSNVTNQGANDSGTFILVGGTKAAAKMRFSGTFSETLVFGPSNTATFSGSLSGKGKYPKSARPLNAECKALEPQL